MQMNIVHIIYTKTVIHTSEPTRIKQKIQIEGHRYDLLFDLVDDEAGTDPLVFTRAPALSRGFFRFESPASFMTILAWISSSLLAFTFFGQKRVTNLAKENDENTKCNLRNQHTSTNVVAIYPDPLHQLP